MVMNAEFVKAKLGALCRREEEVATRLATLDVELDAWLAAMQSGRAVMRVAIRRYAELAAEDARMRDLPAAAEGRRGGLFTTSATAGPKAVGGANSDVGAGQRATPEETKPASASTDDDEALLAQLDEEMARQIRVRHRLSGKTRSVRALVDEYERQRRGTGDDGRDNAVR